MRTSLDRYRKPPGRGYRIRQLTEMQKTDATSKEICKALRDVGCKVSQISSASGEKGIPDILVSFGGVWFVAEIKAPKGVLSTEQIRWHHESKATVFILKTVEDAMTMIGRGALLLEVNG